MSRSTFERTYNVDLSNPNDVWGIALGLASPADGNVQYDRNANDSYNLKLRNGRVGSVERLFTRQQLKVIAAANRVFGYGAGPMAEDALKKSWSGDDDFLKGFSNLFFGSRINSLFNLSIEWDQIGALRSGTGGRTYERTFSIVINTLIKNDQTLLFIVLDHELVHATDIYNGNLDIWRTMANQLGNPQLADIMMEYHAYLSSERVEREFGVDYGATDKVKVLGSMLPPQFLNFFNR